MIRLAQVSIVAVQFLMLSVMFAVAACAPPAGDEAPETPPAETPPVESVQQARVVKAAAPPLDLVPQYFLGADKKHNKFSRAIPPVLKVPSGAVIDVRTSEASDGQLRAGATVDDVVNLDFEPIHPLTGPIEVEGAEPGDVLKVTLHEIELGDYGWVSVSPGFGWLADEFPDAWIRTFEFEDDATEVRFSDGITLPLEPFPGVLGVAPDTDEMLSTIPPRANGGNMDNQYMTEGTVVYLPVFVPGANFSIGDTHALQGDGEVCGTAIEAPMRVILQLDVIKGGRSLPEPQYETPEYYAVTAFAETIDEAAKKATRYMIDYLVEERGMERTEAYVLCSLAGDLKISEVVDVPHVLVSMHMPKGIF